ncbi:MAG: sulfite exporter TauE/SafE family protein [Bacteroidales bacterium]|nr:sulfite exporter TauE/SafE family protein [Bacteroidales bacterium]
MDSVTVTEGIILIIAGTMVGFINTLAGGGSIISLSVLMLLGLPANIANGTNRIGILMQNIAAVGSFSQQKVLDWKKGRWLAIPAVAGSILGAWIAVDINEKAIEYSIAVIMLIMVVFILWKPERWITEKKELIDRKVSWLQIVIFFLIGVYGGFIQMGVGYFLLAGLVLSAGYELVKANALKVLVNFIFTPFALAIFIINGQIDYAYGLILGIGNVMGGLLGSRLAVKKGANFVKWVIIVVIFLTSAQIFGLIDIKGLLVPVLE